MSDQATFWSAITGALIGGGITGYFTLRATKLEHKNTTHRQKESEQRVINGFLQALHDELETIWNRYQDGMGVHLEALEEGKPLLMYYPILQDYFTIYNNNAFLIGRIEDSDLRKSIVEVYTAAKALMDSYRMNNVNVEKYERTLALYNESRTISHQDTLLAVGNNIAAYTQKIRKGHFKLKDEIKILLRSLRTTVEAAAH